MVKRQNSVDSLLWGRRRGNPLTVRIYCASHVSHVARFTRVVVGEGVVKEKVITDSNSLPRLPVHCFGPGPTVLAAVYGPGPGAPVGVLKWGSFNTPYSCTGSCSRTTAGLAGDSWKQSRAEEQHLPATSCPGKPRPPASLARGKTTKLQRSRRQRNKGLRRHGKTLPGKIIPGKTLAAKASHPARPGPRQAPGPGKDMTPASPCTV